MIDSYNPPRPNSVDQTAPMRKLVCTFVVCIQRKTGPLSRQGPCFCTYILSRLVLSPTLANVGTGSQ